MHLMPMPPKRTCDKDTWVAMVLCPICGKDNYIAMDKRACNRFRYGEKLVDPGEVCPACRETYLTDGVLIINPETGSMVVITTTAYDRLIDVPYDDRRIVFCDEAVIAKLLAMQQAAKDHEEETE